MAVSTSCGRERVESPWLIALGFTYLKQEPNWLFNKSIHDIPVGGAIEFYCIDTLKRPKKDTWDPDGEDGIITAHCTHNGDLNIPMNPAGNFIIQN